jgi:hypothetical protein
MVGTKKTFINNILCLVSYVHNSVEQTCTLTIHSKLRPEPITCVLENIVNQDKFYIDDFLPRLQIFLMEANDRSEENQEPGTFHEARFGSQVVITAMDEVQDSWIETFEEGLFYNVPSRMVSYIEGATPRLQMLELSFNIDLDAMTIRAGDYEQNLCISIDLPVIFQAINAFGLSTDSFDEDLYAIKYKYNVITKLLSRWIKSHLRVQKLVGKQGSSDESMTDSQASKFT